MNKAEKIRFIAFIVLLGFVSSILFHYIKGVYLGYPYPHNTFLFLPCDRFKDFINPYFIVRDLNPYFGNNTFPSNYYPFGNMLFFCFTFFPKMIALMVFTGIFVFFVIYFNIFFLWTGRKDIVYVFIISFLTYPFLFAIDRGNVEEMVFVFISLFIIFYYKKQYSISSIFLSFAIAIKAFPAVYLVLFLDKKKYKEIIYVIIFTLFLTIASLLFHEGGFIENAKFILSGFNLKSYWAVKSLCVQRGVSLFTFIKLILIKFGIFSHTSSALFLENYIWSMVVLCIFVVFYVVCIEKETWKKITVLTFSMLLFPYISADYKLIYIFVPICLFVNAERTSRMDYLYVSMFALLLIPKDYYILSDIYSDVGNDISVSVLLNISLIIGISVLIITSSMLHLKKYLKKFLMLIVVGILAITCMCVNKWMFSEMYYKTIRYSGINYNSESNCDVLSNMGYYRMSNNLVREINIKFKMKVNSISNWNNIFQTDDFNRGVRMELANPSCLSLIVGGKTNDRLVDYVVFKISDSIELNKWYSVELSIDRFKNIKVVFDGNVVINENNERIEYSVCDIAVGTGYGKTRPFAGEISDFSLESEYLSMASIETINMILICIFLLVVFLIYKDCTKKDL